MALQQIVIATDIVQDMVTKVNANANLTVTGAQTSGNALELILGSGSLVTVANGLPFRKGAGTSSIQANSATNTASGTGSFAAGLNNTASATSAAVAGGSVNTASFQYAFVGGGLGNSATQNGSAVCGGIGNEANGGGSFVGGGATNSADGTYAAVLAGQSNTATHNNSSIVAGSGITTSEVSTAYAQNFAVASGGKYKVPTGANQIAGTATLVGGTVTVNNTLVSASSIIMLTHQTNAGTAGFVSVTARSAGASFTITSSSGTDTSSIGYFIVEPY